MGGRSCNLWQRGSNCGDDVVQEWILKHGAPILLHSNRGKEFTAALHQDVYDLLLIPKTYSTVYRPQANGMVKLFNKTLLAMLRVVVSEQQDDWDDNLPGMTITARPSIAALGLALTEWSVG